MKTWIFLRGLTRESGHWGGFIEQFQRALPESQVMTLDLPGNGALHQERSPARVADMVAHCRMQLLARGIQAPYHLLAMSLGAMVATAWAQGHPGEIAANVLINTSMRPFNPWYQRLRPANYGRLLRLAGLAAPPEVWERSILRMTSQLQSEAVLKHWLSLRRQHPVSRANAWRQLLAALRFCALTDAMQTPTLLLASEQDQLVNVQCSRTLARHWGCSLQLHPRAGHDLPLDDAVWVADQVRRWLSQQCHESAIKT